jgi:DUF1680 family protein
MKYLLPFLLLFLLSSPVFASIRKSPDFLSVKIEDSFWSPKQSIYRHNSIPNSWQYVTKEIEDNEIAAGWRNETRGSDTPWNQANLHKVMETVAYSLGQEDDPELAKKADHIISAIEAAQQPNGYVNALITVRHMTPWENLDGQHDGYVAGHMIEAAVAYYECTGKRAFLDVACKMADHIYQYFIVEKHPGYCGHAELELALVRLYKITGQKKYLDLAKDWIERRGGEWTRSRPHDRTYFMDQLSISQMQEVTGHAVRSMFYLTGVAGVAAETNDKVLTSAARRLWTDTTTRKMYITGGVGSLDKDEAFGPAYDLPNNSYCESCAACGLIYFAHNMFLLDGKSESIDVLERSLYNNLLHAISLDGKTTYYKNPLTDKDNPRNNCWVCCPPCISRTLLGMQRYIYAYSDSAIYVNLYIGSTATINIKSGPVELSQQTNYPLDGRVNIKFNKLKSSKFELKLRIPGWCRNWTLSVNNKSISKPKLIDGYLCLNRKWSTSDTVTFDMSMPIERIEANPKIKQDNGMVTITRGPVVYGLEGIDNSGNTDSTLAARQEFKSEYRADMLGGITAVTATDNNGKTLTAIPFYAMANRELSSQSIWIKQDGKSENPIGWDGLLYRHYNP